MLDAVACVDVGSTFTKAALVGANGVLLGTASHPTTLGSDVLQGVDACLAGLGAPSAKVLACSSAGGGLRLAVVGYEREVSAEAAFRVGLSAGAKVVHVAAGALSGIAVAALKAERPDVVLLVGGTDGGNSEILLHNARRLGSARLKVPVVLAGNIEAREAAAQLLSSKNIPVVATRNVLPEIGVLDPAGAREAIREVFIKHVIGGKGFSKGPRFARLVKAATPDAVLTGVELLADQVGDVMVVDIGGATTDVYSVVTPKGEDAVPRHAVVETLWRSRTVEGDLGIRWNATGIVAAAVRERLLSPNKTLAEAARFRVENPSFLPDSAQEMEFDLELARLAAVVAVRRHARISGKPLHRVRMVLGSGGVLRHAPAARARDVLAAVTGDLEGGWRLPESPRHVLDSRYVLAAAGLLKLDDADGVDVSRLFDELDR